MMGLIVVVLLPAYYLAKSKGYNIATVLAACAFFSAMPLFINLLTQHEPIPALNLTFPLVALAIVWLLPAKKDAPGKHYLKITFECPECKKEVTFPRCKEGLADLCPKCGEVIHVPMDEFSPKPSIPKRIKPGISSGQVCYASFGDEMLALQMYALLEDNGIESEIIDGTGGGSMPQLSGSQGFKLAIDIDDWDKAAEIEKTALESTEPFV